MLLGPHPKKAHLRSEVVSSPKRAIGKCILLKQLPQLTVKPGNPEMCKREIRPTRVGLYLGDPETWQGLPQRHTHRVAWRAPGVSYPECILRCFPHIRPAGNASRQRVKKTAGDAIPEPKEDTQLPQPSCCHGMSRHGLTLSRGNSALLSSGF